MYIKLDKYNVIKEMRSTSVPDSIKLDNVNLPEDLFNGLYKYVDGKIFFDELASSERLKEIVQREIDIYTKSLIEWGIL